jgi:hypothetical protein
MAVLAMTVVASELRLQRVERQDPLGRRLLYLPTPEFLRLASLGNPQLVADVLYLWAIQYYSLYEPHERFLYLESIFDLITDLDPLYFDAYRMGALIMQIQTGGDEHELKAAVRRLFDKGLDNLPADWQLAETAAWDMVIRFRDFDAAVDYLERAVQTPGAPHRIVRVLGRLKDRRHEWTVADSIDYWQEAVETAEDEFSERMARQHLYDATLRLHRSLLDPVLDDFRSVTGRCPSSWEEVIQAGLLGDVPTDLLGTPYEIDQESCTMFAKRRFRAY